MATSRRPSPSPRVRLQKLLAAAGVTSRRGAEELLRAGRVAVNGEVATLGARADPDHDVVTVDGQPVVREPLVYWMLHKPQGVITTLHDPQGRPTVLELLPEPARRQRLFPVGRLDRDTEGLVLLTNDGALAHALLHPSHESEREYAVTVTGRMPDAALTELAGGIVLDDGPTAPARISAVERRGDATRFRLTVIEGRKRQIRRALEQLGHPVTRLVRLRMGALELGELPAGQAARVGARDLRALIALRDSSAPSRAPRG